MRNNSNISCFITQVTFADSWGMCSDTCSEEYKEESRLTGRARFKHVEIVDQDWCNMRHST